jgi:uncharacterized protein
MKCALGLQMFALVCAAICAQARLSASGGQPTAPSGQEPRPPSGRQPPASGQQPAAPSGQEPSSGTQQPADPYGQQASPVGQNPPPLSSQVPGTPTTPVPITAEPHHRPVLLNDFVHVYNVGVPPLDATLLHQHDLPYLYVTLGQAEIVNAVVGQPQVNLELQDGETHFNPGHFAHLVRTDSGLPFHNITVELVHKQGTAHNLCKEVLPGQPSDCPHESAASGKKPSAEAADDVVPYFETDEVRVELRKVSSGRDYVEEAPKMHGLLVALTNSNLDANLGGEHSEFLHGGDVLWMPAGTHRRVVDFLGTHSSFLLISFKDSAPGPVAAAGSPGDPADPPSVSYRQGGAMARPVVHFEIGCKDTKRTQEFYGKLFDWKIEQQGPAAMIAPGPGGITGHITLLGHEPEHYAIFYVDVNDVQTYLDKAKSLGG